MSIQGLEVRNTPWVECFPRTLHMDLKVPFVVEEVGQETALVGLRCTFLLDYIIIKQHDDITWRFNKHSIVTLLMYNIHTCRYTLTASY